MQTCLLALIEKRKKSEQKKALIDSCAPHLFPRLIAAEGSKTGPQLTANSKRNVRP